MTMQPEPFIVLHDLPAVPTTGNGRRPPPPDEIPPELLQFGTQFTVPPEELEAEDIDGASAVPSVGNPQRHVFFRADLTRTWTLRLLKVPSTGDYYLLDQAVEHPEAETYRVYLLVEREGKTRLCPVRLPRNGDDWPGARQLRAIMADAVEMWVACQWKGGKRGSWRWKRFPDMTDIPRWPDEHVLRLIQRAFDGAIITDPADPRLQEVPILD